MKNRTASAACRRKGWSEWKIQLMLYSKFEKIRSFTLPNMLLQTGEADMISMTSAGYMYEYEVKISKADFKADAKKVYKHFRFKDQPPSTLDNGCFIPNYFSYVCPADMIRVDEVPEYAGLFYADRGIICVKKPVKLHKIIYGDKEINALLRRLYYRYWNLKIKSLKT